VHIGDREAPQSKVTRALRIGVDARELQGATTGVGRYLGELLQRWTARRDANRRTFVLFTSERLLLPLPAGTTEVRVLGTGRGTWWEQTYLRRAVRSEPLDVFFAPAYTAPLGMPVPLAVTIHDISFVAHPEWFRAGEGLRRRWLTRRAAHTAKVVFTVSQFSRSEIERHLGVDPRRIEVIPNGLTPRHLASNGQPREPIVLFVGSIFNRRRLPDVIAAFARATSDMPQARLVVAGDDRTWPKQPLSAVAAAYGVEGRTSLLNYVDDATIADLYARASAFAFLSEYEGFGLTPLEALAAGVPPVVLDTPVAREIYADAAIYVPLGDIGATAEAFRRCLLDPGSVAPLLAKGPAVLQRYSWDDAASRTLEQLERIART
jgi:glycosyltransferase involved in cell wall biosynthesis